MTIIVNTLPFNVRLSEGSTVILQDFSQPPIQAAVMKVAYSDPKPTKDFVGMGKSEGKITFKDAQGKVTGIVSITASVRADVAEADRVSMISTAGALCAEEKFVNVVKRGQLPFNG